MKQFYIYCLIDKTTNKPLYVGQTTNPKRRKYVHLGGYSNISEYVTKHNPNNLEFKVLTSVNTKKEADLCENYFIRYYETGTKGWNTRKNTMIGISMKDNPSEYNKQYHQEYYALPNNKEHHNAQCREYRARPEVKEHTKAVSREWKKDNHERYLAQQKEYRAKPENKERKKVTEKQRAIQNLHSDEGQEVVKLHLEGYSQRKIGELIGKSQKHVCNILKVYKEELQKKGVA